MKRGVECSDNLFILELLPNELIKVIFLWCPCREMLFVSRRIRTLLVGLEVKWYDVLLMPWIDPYHDPSDDTEPLDPRRRVASSIHYQMLDCAGPAVSRSLANEVALFFDSVWRAKDPHGRLALELYLCGTWTPSDEPRPLACHNYHRRDLRVTCVVPLGRDAISYAVVLFNGHGFNRLRSDRGYDGARPSLRTMSTLAQKGALRKDYGNPHPNHWENEIKAHIIRSYNGAWHGIGPLHASCFQYENDHVKDRLRPYRTNWLLYDESLHLVGTAFVLYEYVNEPVVIPDKKKHLVLMNCVDKNLQCVATSQTYLTEFMLCKYLLETNYDVVVDIMFMLLIQKYEPYIKFDVTPNPFLLEYALKKQRAWVDDLLVYQRSNKGSIS